MSRRRARKIRRAKPGAGGVDKPGLPAKTRPSILESCLTALAALLALWILVTTVNVARSGWTSVPIEDDWDRWITYLQAPHSLAWFFKQHLDHRLVVPKVLFEIDHFLFHARGWFTLLCVFCLQALTGILLWRLSAGVWRQDRAERLILAAVIAACIFSGQQWVNFVWPFQVEFPLVYCAATAALFSLWKGGQRDGTVTGVAWIAASIAAATAATYSMANGVLLWPVLLLAAFWLRMPRRWMAALAAGALLLGAPYFYHWHRAIAPVFRPSERWPRAAIFLLAHLGAPLSPLARLFDSDNARLATVAIPGGLLALALLAGFTMLWRSRERHNNARAMVMFYCVFLAGSSVSMAYGRADQPLTEAFTPRYLTPSYILWICVLIVAWPWLRQVHRATLYATLCAAMLVGIAIHQQTVLTTVRSWRLRIHLGEAALVDNVTDVAAWAPLFHTPRFAMDAVDFLRNNRLSIFFEEWSRWPDVSINQRFIIDRNPNACQGMFEQAMLAPSPLKPGWRATGWAWDIKAGLPPRHIVLADENGQVAGVGLTGFPQRRDLAAAFPQYLGSVWNGYVSGLPRPITAYVVEADERSLCAIGTRQLPAATTASLRKPN
jgi:hypothetical protein